MTVYLYDAREIVSLVCLEKRAGYRGGCLEDDGDDDDGELKLSHGHLLERRSIGDTSHCQWDLPPAGASDHSPTSAQPRSRRDRWVCTADDRFEIDGSIAEKGDEVEA